MVSKMRVRVLVILVALCLVIVLGVYVLVWDGEMLDRRDENFVKGDDDTVNDLLNSVIRFISENHPEAAPLIQDPMIWMRSGKDMRVGYTLTEFRSDGWIATLGHAFTAERVYEIKVEHRKGLLWKGTIKDGVISEQHYSYMEDT